MTYRLDAAATEPCVWMSAGVLTYKLCDRHFDCEHCPLYAAMHCVPQDADDYFRTNQMAMHHLEAVYPDDCLYSDGHTWLKPIERRSEHFQFGLDNFVTSMIACPRHVRWNATPRILKRGETVCVLEFDDGTLSIGTPVVARLSDRNRALDDDPGAIITEPYGDGWIVILSQVEQGEFARLHSAKAAQEQARLDLRRLRRRIAFRLLADEGDVAPVPTPGGELCADPWHAFGGVGHLDLMRELVH